MGHIPNENVDDVVPELGVEGNNVLPEHPRIDEDPNIALLLDNFLNENMDQPFLPAFQEPDIGDPQPPLNLEFHLPFRPAAVAHPEPHFPRERYLRPPPIVVSIPLENREHEASAEEFRIEVLYRGRYLPLRYSNRVLNSRFSDRRRRVRENIPPPTMPQLRFQNEPRTLCLGRLSSQRPMSTSVTSPRSVNGRNSSDGDQHPHDGRPQPFNLKAHKRLRRSRLCQCLCKMNRIDLEVSLDNDHEEEEEDDDDDDDDYKLNACEAYKDLHYDNYSDDDDDSDDNHPPNMQILF